MKQYYKILGLEEGASQEEIEAAYKRLSKEFDPKNNNDQEFFKEEYEKVQEAYRALSNSSIIIFSVLLSAELTKSPGPLDETCKFSISPKSLINDFDAFMQAL